MGDYSDNTRKLEDEGKPHILAFPFPIPGHINPLMYFCKRLASAGFSITFACNQETSGLAIRTRDLVAARSSSNLSLESRIRVISLPDGLPLKDAAEKSKSNPSENLERPAKSALGMREPLMELIQELNEQGNQVACILTDTFNGWVQDVADKFNIPKAVFWTSNAINDIVHLRVPQLRERGFVPVTEYKGEAMVDILPGFDPIPATDLPLSFYYDHPILDTVADGARRFPEAAFALSNTLEELEPHAVSVLRSEFKGQYYCVGPCLSQDFFVRPEDLDRSSKALSPEDLRCLNWLDTQAKSSVIYVSFGSVAIMSVEQAQELAMGLERSGHKFLLVIRKNLVSDEGFYHGLVERTKGRGLVVAWAPQMHVLLHPSVGGFLTHCGWNSTLEAICAGVPMLTWPCMAEQNINCRELVHNWKIGLEVPGWAGPEIVPAATVASLVAELMGAKSGTAMRLRAERLRDTAAAAIAPGGSSDRAMHAFTAGIAAATARQ